MRAMIAEEHPLTRHAIHALLTRLGHEVVHESGDGQDAYLKAAQLEPDMLVLGLRLQHLGGLEVIQRLRQRKLATRILVLTAQDSPHVIDLCIGAGAAGFVSKLASIEELTEAITAISKDRTYYPALGVRAGAHDNDEEAQVRSLSPRELTVLYYLAQGYANREIAAALNISDRTVSTYKIRLQEKLNVKSVIELAGIARRHHILSVDAEAAPATPGIPLSAGQLDDPAQLYALLDAIPMAVGIRAPDGMLRFANTTMKAFHARRGMNLQGTDLKGLAAYMDADALAHAQTVFAEAVSAGKSFRLEMISRVGQGIVSFLYWGAPMTGPDGEVQAVLCGTLNLSDLEATFLDLRHAKERVEAAGKARCMLLEQSAARSRQAQGVLEDMLADLRTWQADLPPAIAARLPAVIEARQVLAERLTSFEQLVALEDNGVLMNSSCRLRTLVSGLLPEQHALAQARGITLQVTLDGTEHDEVWLDQRRFAAALQSLLGYCIRTAPASELQLHVHLTLQNRALLAVQISASSGEAPLAPLVAGPDDGLADLILCGDLVEAMGGRLSVHGTQAQIDLMFSRSAMSAGKVRKA
ncbi:response regulator [Silvimonas iriomotensis]|uniref:Response regulator n=1 Tax=Silvimonas iriomotensis TaxID=449662 RepID=A0ABQ2P5K8_9NEIS|nr:response regulator transcription factor [Silvimonas iriomotensis]GGP18814.1 hypothetical protein GCM10010970_07490 [Silvimonas iriomotensis]